MKVLILATDYDGPWLPALRSMFPEGFAVQVANASGKLFKIEHLSKILDKTGSDYLVTCDYEICSLLTGKKFKEPGKDGQGESVYNYGGSFIKLACGRFALIVPPPQQLRVTNEGPWLFERWISKITKPELWPAQPTFKWQVVDSEYLFLKAYEKTCASPIVALDIETGTRLDITEFGWAAYCAEEDTVYSYIIYPRTLADVERIREICDTPPPKTMHNGCYDSSWLLAYNAPVRNWQLDSLGMMQSWVPELPRDLGFTAALAMREVSYWKTDHASSDLSLRAMYNARDTYNTLVSTVHLLRIFSLEAPWAFENFKIRFPLVFPSVHEGMEGFHVDQAAKAAMEKEQVAALESALNRLRGWLRWPTFNPSSHVQVKLLMNAMTEKGAKWTSSDDKHLEKFAKQGVLHKKIVNAIQDFRGAAKLLSTYVNAPLFAGRFHYSLNPFGTDSCRSTSKKSHFRVKVGSDWVAFGGQIQNVPAYVKKMLAADPGWLLYDIDKSASESWCTAAIAREPGLWDALESGKDFHCLNGAMFFGMTYEEVVAERKAAKAAGKKDGEIRSLSKRVNHGANYNMQEAVMVETLGEDNIFKAKRLLLKVYEEKKDVEKYRRLRSCISAQDVAGFLLGGFEKIYPRIRGAWQKELTEEVHNTGLLVAPSGWTRKTFLKPWKSKMDLNAVVSFKPQHLSVVLLDKSRYEIWKKFALGPNPRIRPKAQVHDALTAGYRPNDSAVVDEAELLMRVSLDLGYSINGVPKVLCIPNDAQGGGTSWASVGTDNWRNHV